MEKSRYFQAKARYFQATFGAISHFAPPTSPNRNPIGGIGRPRFWMSQLELLGGSGRGFPLYRWLVGFMENAKQKSMMNRGSPMYVETSILSAKDLLTGLFHLATLKSHWVFV